MGVITRYRIFTHSSPRFMSPRRSQSSNLGTDAGRDKEAILWVRTTAGPFQASPEMVCLECIIPHLVRILCSCQTTPHSSNQKPPAIQFQLPNKPEPHPVTLLQLALVDRRNGTPPSRLMKMTECTEHGTDIDRVPSRKTGGDVYCLEHALERG